MPTHPTLINLPPPPSDPVTPSDIPGTPNSATTTMSELSTVAIKDGHRGHTSHTHRTSAQPGQDAERADRISRLAGLERVTAVRNNSSQNANLTPGTSYPQQFGNQPGYFDGSGQPQMGRERSTVGSASATGSVGGRTTWASGSDVYDPDKMSDTQDMEMDTSSVGGMSDEQNSLVGFGEGARTPARQSAYGSPGFGKSTPTGQPVPFAPREQSMTPVGAHMASEQQRAKVLDGQTYDQGSVDSSGRMAPRGGSATGIGTETAERIMGEGFGNGGTANAPGQGAGDLGRFDFENK